MSRLQAEAETQKEKPLYVFNVALIRRQRARHRAAKT
jgi:hypothetical protein